MDRIAVVAIGGNSLIAVGQVGTIAEQFENARSAAVSLARLAAAGWRIALVHGNGPQVGFILRRSESAPEVAPRLSLDMCDADAQGGIGYILQQTLGNALRARGIDRPVVALVTQVEVDPTDRAFQHPTKPIGDYYTETQAEAFRAEQGWQLEREGQRGWRRVVPSPMPRAIVELEVIRRLVDDGVIVICSGGGGIPVACAADGQLSGLEAVVDKDRVSCLLARSIGADVLVISTVVAQVALDYGTANERPIDRMSAAEAMQHLAEGQFPPGSMGPKIEAAVDFLHGGGRRVLVTDLAHISDALDGEAGTWIEP